MHRPLALTPVTRDRILTYLRAGNYIETACKASGIHKDTYYGWMERARKGEEPFATFAAEVDEALAAAEMLDLATIHAASHNQWQAAAWKLERRHPSRWSRREHVNVKVKEELSAALDKLESTLDPKVYEQVLNVLSGESSEGEEEGGEE